VKEIVYDGAGELVAWAQDRIAGGSFRDDAKAIGLSEDGKLRGVVVYDNFTTTGCWISVASDMSRRWITREFIIRAMAYPFLQLGYPRINAFVSCCEGFGWTREGILREGGHDGEDLIVFGMLRRECRWLPARFAGKTGRRRL
jgi:RimJ/RimL family protein N-acetyltransferase